MELHFRCGYASFVASPREVFSYLARIKNKEAIRSIGHNPAGVRIILALIETVLFIVASGLLANDDMILKGPSKHVSDLVTALYKQSFDGLLALSVWQHSLRWLSSNPKFYGIVCFPKGTFISLISKFWNGSKLFAHNSPAFCDSIKRKII